MNREQMVEKARDEISAWDNDCGCPIPGDLAESIGASVLDAILPQVTTVAELEAFGPEALVVDSTGLALVAECVLETDFKRGPLTVVWQPEVAA